MKNQILLAFIAITVLACSNSSESVASMDAKSLKIKSHINAYMNNDSSVAEKLFTEDLELYDQFSNNQKDGETLSNPGGNMALIEADKFTHVLFSEINCTTDNIKTYTDTNGDVYTVFWSMWSGKGNFTGANTTIPFHLFCIQSHKNYQIQFLYLQFLDFYPPTQLDNLDLDFLKLNLVH